MAEELYPACARCAKMICNPPIRADEAPPLDEAPTSCPMKLHPDLVERTAKEYDRPEVKEFARWHLCRNLNVMNGVKRA